MLGSEECDDMHLGELQLRLGGECGQPVRCATASFVVGVVEPSVSVTVVLGA